MSFKPLLPFILIISILNGLYAQQDHKTEYQQAFAKAYGYVKYFHPSDGASNIDWGKFAIYGAGKIESCETKDEVVDMLNQLYKPIAPSVNFYQSETKASFNAEIITPKDLKGYKLTYWQHNGISLGMNTSGSTYKSSRVNGEMTIDKASDYASLWYTLKASSFQGRLFKYSGWVKLEEGSQGSGHLWFRAKGADGKIIMLDNMALRPIKGTEWSRYEIVAEVDSPVETLAVGCYLDGKGEMLVDDLALAYKSGDNWIDIPIDNGDFETGKLNDEPWSNRGEGYKFSITDEGAHQSTKAASIAYKGDIKVFTGSELFKHSPKFGEMIEKEIAPGIFCQIPLALYTSKRGTFPPANEQQFDRLNEKLNKVSDDPSELPLRLGNVINAYNVFQHFYPYFDVVNVDWDLELAKALNRSYQDKGRNDHLITLQKFTATLNDGHIGVRGGDLPRHMPPISWEWVGDKLVITKLHEQNTGLAVGDVVTHINNQKSSDFFKEVYSRISAGTQGWKDYLAKNSSLYGEKDSEMSITVEGRETAVNRTIHVASLPASEPERPMYRMIGNGIVYLNLDIAPMDTIESLMPSLEQASGIICDLRGYPKNNHRLIQHLLANNDTTDYWMQVPQVIYPDQENLEHYKNHGWGMKTKKPYLGDKKVVFIIDGRAISYAESYMGYIEGYKLATIIGQPTAGTNGNINPFRLPGGYRINWTGMKVSKHDRSQHHGIGITPDMYVNKTIEGIKAGRDEFLDKAIEIVSQE
ncbi:MAG: S41 family peptidase [Bacteroidota bacterium]